MTESGPALSPGFWLHTPFLVLASAGRLEHGVGCPRSRRARIG